MVTIKTREEIQIMREGGGKLAEILQELKKKVRPGITTEELNELAEKLILKAGGKPNFKGYQSFPTAICTSLNEELVHCLPSKRKLKEGDIISIDIGMEYRGFHTDMARTFPVGKISFEAQRLIRVTKKALKRGIKEVKIGKRIGDISNAIQKYVEKEGFNVVRELSGHGIGKKLHEEPKIPNFGEKGLGVEIKEGMVFCIEPMVTIGDWRLKKAKDKYGFKTKDNSLSSHFEDMVAVTKKGPLILTR